MSLFKKLVLRLNFYWVKLKFFLFTTNPKPINKSYLDEWMEDLVKRSKKHQEKLGAHLLEWRQGIEPHIFQINDTEEELIKKYGPPNSEEINDFGQLEFTHRIWKTELGDIHRFTVKEPDINLEEQMKEAIENENFELAAELRDKINGKYLTKDEYQVIKNRDEMLKDL